MKINIEFKLLVVLCQLCDGYFRGPNRRLIFLRWLNVKSIQILTESVQTIVPSGNAVGVQGWNNFENIIFPQKSSLLAFQVGD